MANKITSIVPTGANNYLTPSLSFNRTPTDFITPGVVGAFAFNAGSGGTGAGAINAQGSPNMTVAVTQGVFYVNATPSGGTAQIFSVTQDVSENVTISANATGSTKYDFLYLQLSATLLNAPDSANTTVATFITQRSTTQFADSNGAAANGLLLAVIAVANGASSITNSNIADYRVNADPTEIDGWYNANETWTYASATTITTSTAAGKYAIGDKIRLWQSGVVAYFYIVGISGTVITITGGSDYTLANATITNPGYSHAESPVGFPQWFNYAPTVTGFSATPTGTINRFYISGRKVTLSIYQATAGTSNATTFTISLPVTSANPGVAQWESVVTSISDNSSGLTTPGRAYIPNSGTVLTLSKDINGAAWTASGTKRGSVQIFYEI